MAAVCMIRPDGTFPLRKITTFMFKILTKAVRLILGMEGKLKATLQVKGGAMQRGSEHVIFLISILVNSGVQTSDNNGLLQSAATNQDQRRLQGPFPVTAEIVLERNILFQEQQLSAA
ncbi:hypothetical protein GDO81_021723 [Engystomops pustulosus]|uniref:Uncharacterized protein n=1 Tax=Engystomops pustulosus TaxID=76066 RepID=A0AAV6Z5H5_ENGPU|nr:hypothetical protein GDO81_021723 [Engystomops pustulosus]